MADKKEELEGKEAADRVDLQSERSPFEILDEVEQEGGFTLSSISEEVEGEIIKEKAETEGDGTGLKADKTKTEQESEEEAEQEEAEQSEEEEAEATDENEETEEEVAEEETVEETEAKQPQWLIDKLKEDNPELDVEDEAAVQEAIDSAISSKQEVEQIRKDLEEEREANKSFYELLENSEELRELSRYMFKNNADIETALTALDISPKVDMEKLKKEDPDAYIEAVEAQKKKDEEAKKADAKRKETEQKFKENEAKSFENAEAVKKDLGMDDASFDEFTERVNPEIQNLSEGLVTKNLLSIFHKGLTYEDAVAQAREEGLTEGKNTKIEEHTRRKKGDNLPKIDTSAPKVAEKEEDDIFSKALEPEPRISEIK